MNVSGYKTQKTHRNKQTFIKGKMGLTALERSVTKVSCVEVVAKIEGFVHKTSQTTTTVKITTHDVFFSEKIIKWQTQAFP